MFLFLSEAKKIRMKIRNVFLWLIFVLNTHCIFSQNEKTQLFSFIPLIDNFVFILNDSYCKLNSKDSIQIETLKFYISKIELLNNDVSVWQEENSFHLIDISSDKSKLISFKIPSQLHFNKIKFNLGIDSITNVSGAMGGDLDPTRGMYWTWQNGYINFKIEGKSNLCTTRNHEFQFHLGGYQYPYNTLQTVILNAEEKEIINITFDIKTLLNSINLTSQNHIMSPGAEAVQLSQKASKIFTVQ
jgi:hypothetical protein